MWDARGRASTATARRSSRATRASAGRTHELDAQVERVRARRCSRSASSAATASASGRRTTPSGSSSSSRRRGSARSSSTSTRPTGAHELEYALRQSGCSLLILAPGFKDADYVELLEGVGRAGAARADRARRTAGTTLLARGRRRAGRRAARARGRARLRPADQHPVHVGHDGVPEGRDALAPQHPQQRLLHRRDAAATRRPTASACRCRSTTASAWCSATSRSSRTAPASSSPPRRSTPRAVLEAVQAGALHVAVRRADDVHRRARTTPTSTSFDLSTPAHRDHGRLAVPGRGDEARAVARCTWTR